MKVFNNCEKWLIKIIQIICIIFFAAMVILVGLQVFMRFVAKNAVDMSWSEEAVRFLLCWMTFLGCVVLFENHGHVWVANLVDSVPKPVRRILLIAAHIVEIAFVAMIFVGTNKFMPIVATQKSNVLHIPMNYVYIIIPITAALIGIFAVRDLILLIIGKGEVEKDG